MRNLMVAMLFMLNSCATPTELAGPAILFSTSPASLGEDQAPEVSILNLVMRITGVIVTPDPCHSAHGSAEVDGRRLSLLLCTTGSEGPCFTVLGALRYEARIVMPVPGPYEVTVWLDGRPRSGQRWHLSGVGGNR